MDRRRFVAGGLGGLGGLATGLVRLPSALAAPAPAWPGASWAGLAPAAAGFDPARLTSAVDHAKSLKLGHSRAHLFLTNVELLHKLLWIGETIRSGS